MSRVVTVRWWDLAALAAWVGVLVLAVMTTIVGRLCVEGMWAILLSPVATSLTVIAWNCRHQPQGYQQGVDAGLAMAGVVRLKDHERV